MTEMASNCFYESVHPQVGSASRVQLVIHRDELGTFLEKSCYTGYDPIMHQELVTNTQTIIFIKQFQARGETRL